MTFKGLLGCPKSKGKFSTVTLCNSVLRGKGHSKTRCRVTNGKLDQAFVLPIILFLIPNSTYSTNQMFQLFNLNIIDPLHQGFLLHHPIPVWQQCHHAPCCCSPPPHRHIPPPLHAAFPGPVNITLCIRPFVCRLPERCWRATKLLRSCESCSSRCCWQHPHAVKWS